MKIFLVFFLILGSSIAGAARARYCESQVNQDGTRYKIAFFKTFSDSIYPRSIIYSLIETNKKSVCFSSIARLANLSSAAYSFTLGLSSTTGQVENQWGTAGLEIYRTPGSRDSDVLSGKIFERIVIGMGTGAVLSEVKCWKADEETIQNQIDCYGL